MGGALAFELARARLGVLLLERGEPGQEASWAAAGMLMPAPDAEDSVPLVPLARESDRHYPDFISAVEAASGKSTGYRRDGALEIFFGPEGEAERDRRIVTIRSHGISAEAITLEEARRKEPTLGNAAQAALWIEDEARVDPRALTGAVLLAASRAGAEIRGNSDVVSIIVEGGHCQGVLTVARRKISAGPVAVKTAEKINSQHVVIAAGCYSNSIGGTERYAPTRPVRGQMVAMAAEKVPHIVLRSEQGYVVPREDGRAVAGSTLENAAFDKQVTPAGLLQILGAAVELAPALANAAVVETWAGLRPDTPDHLPVLGPTDIEGLHIATGHYRNGILLAPATAKCLSEWIAAGKTSPFFDTFSPLRFGEEKRGAAR